MALTSEGGVLAGQVLTTSSAITSTGDSGAARRKTDARAASSAESTDGGEMTGPGIGRASTPVEMARGSTITDASRRPTAAASKVHWVHGEPGLAGNTEAVP